MVKVLTYDIPDYKIKLKIRQLHVMGKNIQGKLITQAMNEPQSEVKNFISYFCLLEGN